MIGEECMITKWLAGGTNDNKIIGDGCMMKRFEVGAEL